METKSIIIINPYCHQGRGWKRWVTVKNEVLQLFNHSAKELILEKGMSLDSVLPELLKEDQHYHIISAGGDGSLHFLINTLLKPFSINLENITLGAIGLGSSNDFLKPFTKKISNIPVRIDYSGPVIQHDVGLATYHAENGHYKNKYFIVNASFGATATANWNFNNPGNVLKFLKSHFTSGAILYTALTSILRHKNTDCSIKFNNRDMTISMSNINIIKKIFVSGSFWYNQEISANDGKLGFNMCRDMNTIELLKTLMQLGKGKFRPDEKKMTEIIYSFRLNSKKPLVFECDGEAEYANDISISVIPGAIKILAN